MYNTKELLLEIVTMAYTNLDIYERLKECICDYDKKDIRKSDEEKRFQNNILNIYRHLNKRQTISNIKEIDLLLKKNYFSCIRKQAINMDLLENFYKLANEFFSHRKSKVCLKYWEDKIDLKDYSSRDYILSPYSGFEKINLWNSLNRMISTDVLVCLYLSRKERERPNSKLVKELEENLIDEDLDIPINLLDEVYNQIEIKDLQLETVLKRGISETHLHASAGNNFQQTWMVLMDFTKGSNMDLGIEKWLEDQPIISNDKSDYRELIPIAGLIRLILTLYFSNENTLINFIEFIEHWEKEIDLDIQYSDSLSKIFIEERVSDFEYEELLEINKKIVEYLREYYEIDDYNKTKRDILVWYFLNNSDRDLKTTGENIFLFKIFRGINNPSNRNHKDVSKLILKYINIKNMVYQEHVQQNQIKGLKNFKKYFKTSTKTIRKKDKKPWEEILRNQIQDDNLKKIELRISMEDGDIASIKDDLKETINNILKIYYKIIKSEKNKNREKNGNFPVIGFIIHLIKRRDTKQEKCWLSYDEDKPNSEKKISFLKHRKVYFKQIIALKKLIREDEIIGKFIVGIDTASTETATPPWVFAPIYNYARDGKDYIRNIGHKKNHLGFTYHVGEDFRHVLTGLRHVDEVIDHCGFHSGDRIGHGIVLGVDIKKWVQKYPVVILPRIEYLENLLWLWGLSKDEKLTLDLDNYLERKILEIANDIFKYMEGITVFELWKAYTNKFNEIEINNLFKTGKDKTIYNKEDEEKGPINKLFCCETNNSHTYLWNSEKLGHAYHCNVYRKRMDEPISVSTNDFSLDVLEKIQKLVCNLVSKKGIIVETNPSSNRAIGEIEDIFEHYILYLKNKRFDQNKTYDRLNNLIVTINTDDPSVFNTSLSNEFAYIYYALLYKGYDKKDVLDWIEDVRENGMKYSFIDMKYEEMIQHLKCLQERDDTI